MWVTSALFLLTAGSVPAGAASEHTVIAEDMGDDSWWMDDLSVSSVESFSRDGGEALINPGGASEERIWYDSIDSAMNRLITIRRESPKTQVSGTSIEPYVASDASTSSAESTDIIDPEPPAVTALPEVPIGQVFSRNFDNPSDSIRQSSSDRCTYVSGGDGIPDDFNDDCSPHSRWDLNPNDSAFSSGISNGNVRLTINSIAEICCDRGGGDHGFHLTYRHSGTRTYRASAMVKLNNVSRTAEEDFRGRVTIHAFNTSGTVAPMECNGVLFAAGQPFTQVETGACPVPSTMNRVRVNFRAKSLRKSTTNQAVAGYGNVILDSVFFERIS